MTLDLSHTSVSGTPALEMAADLGERLTHVHLADGTGLGARRAPHPRARACSRAPSCSSSWPAAGSRAPSVLEVSTRKAANRAEREVELAEALAFARLHLAAPLTPRRPDADQPAALRRAAPARGLVG